MMADDVQREVRAVGRGTPVADEPVDLSSLEPPSRLGWYVVRRGVPCTAHVAIVMPTAGPDHAEVFAEGRSRKMSDPFFHGATWIGPLATKYAALHAIPDGERAVLSSTGACRAARRRTGT
jgi:hypothetical protein